MAGIPGALVLHIPLEQRLYPQLRRDVVRTDHPVDLAILGNSITLTPGTLTLQIRDGHFTVHALTESGADDLMSGEMDRRVSELRRR